MRRLGLLTLLFMVLGAAPAWAHEEINPSTFPVNTPVFLTLTAANEKTVKLTKVTLSPPAGLTFGATTRDPAGWTVSRTDALVTWTGGSVDPGHFDSFGFELEEAPQPGVLSYKATLGYADGTSDDVTVQVTATAAISPGGSAGSSASGGSGRADLALVVGGLALVAAVVALVGSRRDPSAAPVRGSEQDW